MTATEIQNFIIDTIPSYGFIPNDNAKIRASLDCTGIHFFAITRPEEEANGPYHDYSFVAFSSDDEKKIMLTLCVGTLGLKNDTPSAILPKILNQLNMFGKSKLTNPNANESFFLKSDLSDVASTHPALETYATGEFKKSVNRYKQYVPVGEILSLSEMNDTEIKSRIAKWLELYGKIRSL